MLPVGMLLGLGHVGFSGVLFLVECGDEGSRWI